MTFPRKPPVTADIIVAVPDRSEAARCGASVMTTWADASFATTAATASWGSCPRKSESAAPSIDRDGPERRSTSALPARESAICSRPCSSATTTTFCDRTLVLCGDEWPAENPRAKTPASRYAKVTASGFENSATRPQVGHFTVSGTSSGRTIFAPQCGQEVDGEVTGFLGGEDGIVRCELSDSVRMDLGRHEIS